MILPADDLRPEIPAIVAACTLVLCGIHLLTSAPFPPAINISCHQLIKSLGALQKPRKGRLPLRNGNESHIHFQLSASAGATARNGASRPGPAGRILTNPRHPRWQSFLCI